MHRVLLLIPIIFTLGCDLFSAPPGPGEGEGEGEGPPGCVEHVDCRGGELCADGVCREACEVSDDCDSAEAPACDVQAGLCVECVTGGDCDEGFTCSDNECARACGSDDDCLIDAFFCDLVSGACVARECQEDGDCAGGELCRGSLCVPVEDPPPEVCLPGLVSCEGNALVTCNADGSAESVVPCGAEAACLDDGTPACTPLVCAPNVVGCADENTASICNATGTAAQEIDCNQDQVCQSGVCRNLQCEANSATCEGDNLVRCNESGTDASVVACDNTSECIFEADGCTCDLDACVPRVCAPGARECVATGFRACRADGLGFSDVEACDDVCVAGECVSSTCAPGEAACAGATLLTCNAQGTGFNTTDCGGNGETCVDDGTPACDAQACSPLSVRCEGDSVARCDSFGTDETLTPCGETQRCEAGACVDDAPVSDARLVVQLVWTSSDGDLDLHLSREPDEALCANDSCFYETCKPGSIFGDSRPDWDGSGGLSAGDPGLDLDDLDGFGPEIISVQAPVSGSYRARVHVFTAMAAPTIATIRVIADGVIVGEHQQVISADQQLWDGVDIAVGALNISSVDTGTIHEGADCDFVPGEEPPPPGDSCITNADCPSTEFCGTGLTCTPGCRENADCAFPTLFCTGDGSCQVTAAGFGQSCQGNADCGAGLYCDLFLTQSCVETCDPSIVDCGADATCCAQSGAATCIDAGIPFFVRPTCFELPEGQ